jgi:hypothetical protein
MSCSACCRALAAASLPSACMIHRHLAYASPTASVTNSHGTETLSRQTEGISAAFYSRSRHKLGHTLLQTSALESVSIFLAMSFNKEMSYSRSDGEQSLSKNSCRQHQINHQPIYTERLEANQRRACSRSRAERVYLAPATVFKLFISSSVQRPALA